MNPDSQLSAEYRPGRFRGGMSLRVRRSLSASAACVAVLLVAALCTSVTSAADPVARTGGAAAAAAAQARTDDPNIVYVLVDDMNLDDLKYMPVTRQLIGRNGRTYKNAISHHPVCCPARAGILTGQYGQNNGVKHNKGKHGGYRVFRPTSTIATWLQDAGYQTAMHGKYLNKYEKTLSANPDRRTPEAGWTIWDPLVAGIYDYRTFQFFNGDKFGYGSKHDYVTTRLTERSINSIEQFSARRDPFFVMVNHIAPHNAYGPSHRAPSRPAVYEAKYARKFRGDAAWSMRKKSYNRNNSALPRAYQRKHKVKDRKVIRHFRARIRSLQSVDDSVRALRTALRQAGEWDNTYFVFTSDNGYSLGEHRILKKDKLIQEHLDVPLLISGPGIKPGSRSSRIVSLLDVTATLIGRTSATPTHQMDGADFADDLLQSRTARPNRWRRATLVQTGSEKTSDGWSFRGVQTKRYLYGKSWRGKGKRSTFLYDRRKDRFELVNEARNPAYRRVAQVLDRQTHRLATCAGAECNQRLRRPGHPTHGGTFRR